jgi:phosphonate transport system substrate-binding protein
MRPVPWKPPASRAACAALAVALAACGSSVYREKEVSLAPAAVTERPIGDPTQPRALRFSVAAMESPRDTYAAYSRLFERVGERLGVGIELVQRRTYREVNDLLASGQLDAALVCTGGYFDLSRRAPGAVEVLAVPVVAGESTYESLVIVPAASRARTIADLAGKRFAYTDELSFSGRAYAVWFIRHAGHDPERFFSSVTYTHNHDRSIAAVSRGIVDGAAVHGIIFRHLVERDPELARRVRVLHRSPPFGMMPIVASNRLPPAERDRLRRVLIDLADDAAGAAALEMLHIERFAPAAPGLYDSAARVVEGRP